MPKTREVTRRGFLKTAGALGVVAGSMATADAWLQPAVAHAAADPTATSEAFLYHRTHCGCHCSLKCTVRDGRVCLIEPNDAYQDEQYRHVCVKGLSEIQHIYSAERIQSPMKRVGERGSAQFEAISWDEAYDILIENLQKVWDAYGRESVLVHASSESRPYYMFLPAILGASTQGAVGIDIGLGNGRDVAFGPSKGTTKKTKGENTQVGVGWNRPTNEARDLINSKYILLVGNNVFHSVLTRSSLLLDAQKAGAKLVAVDPNYSQVAQKSDEWVPIQPGTDAAFYLGLASEIVHEKLYDESFMKNRTDFAFLVNVETGKRLVLDGESEGGESRGGNAVWDASTDSLAHHDAAVDPALSGVHAIDGASYCTVFDLLVKSLEDFTVEKASEITDIPVDKLKEIARDYAMSGASNIVTGYGGNDKMANADIAGHALAALAALTGNIGKPGAGSGTFADGFHGYNAALGSWKLPENLKSSTLKTPFFLLPYEENDIHMAIIAGDSPMNRTANYSRTEEWLDSLDFLCAIDMYFTSYTDHADLVLPACTAFECEGDYAGVEAYGGYVLLREKAIDPVFESKSDFQIQLDIAERLGLRDALPKDMTEYIERVLETSNDETIAHVTLESLVANQGLQAQSCQSVFRVAYEDTFGTPSGKLELYYEAMLPYGQQLPVWEESLEVGADNELRERYPLHFATFKSKFRVHNQFWDSAWNNQFESGRIEMNPKDMLSRGLSDGDTVRVYNDRGEFVVDVAGNEAVRPGCVRMPSGAWKKNVKSGCFQNVSNHAVVERHSKLPLGLLILFNDTLVEIEKA